MAALAESSPEGLADAVCDLLQNDERRHALSARAEKFARAQTWDMVAKDFEAALLHARTQQQVEAS